MNTQSAWAEMEYSVWLTSQYMSTTLDTLAIVVPLDYKALF